MADLKRTIEILFEGTNNTGTAITAVGRGLDNLNYQVASRGPAVRRFHHRRGKARCRIGRPGRRRPDLCLQRILQAAERLHRTEKGGRRQCGGPGGCQGQCQGPCPTPMAKRHPTFLLRRPTMFRPAIRSRSRWQLAKTGMDLVIAGGVEASQSSETLIASLKGFQAAGFRGRSVAGYPQ